ncbi:phosphotransferase family protein [Lacticaseibacillus saniviri]|uniref:Aminoglycoside phosphotransferase n=1 Tax=Lacticaseibacillus saniviri JCM 17471 = DSM 24301 TaxID=1293598 RepID=A0A0R2MWQ1_9LACO|nr:phosphotransferase family protein [Lacticaseibacillus saniviri]KRO16672.1 aminoglycoside phosphotransferase [Lacticaseibacillus saniviri JCM 17471 = DSM 24301]MCG4280816.1 phosphotransferase family protein [Lacticaseibacillus saniviri]
MDFDLDASWSIKPAGGTTGTAFIGIHANEKYFLKRNASPFLAALSVEHVTPKLIWTKRIVTGDVLTAQEWLDGRTLKRFEMDNRQVARLLGRVHNSDLLKKMLTRMGGAPEEPKTFLNRLALDTAVKQMPVVQRGLSFLQQLPEAPRAYRVCHGDLSHKNWLISNQKQLYLVDWDQAVLSDVAYDLSFILVNYVARPRWEHWLHTYGAALTPALERRISWYGVYHLVNEINQFYLEQRQDAVQHTVARLEALLANAAEA